MSNSFYLTGFMGAGKTTLARLLGQKTGLPWCDLDILIQRQQGKTIQEIFSEHGEPYFRKLERDTLYSIDRPSVVGLGGGAFVQPEVRAHIALSGISICLDLNVGQTWERVRGKTRRPLVKSFGELIWLMKVRYSIYGSADLTFPLSGMESPSHVAGSVFELLVSGGFMA